MKRDNSLYSSGTISTACDLWESAARTNAELDSFILDYGLEEHVQRRGAISKTMLAIREFAVQQPEHVVDTDRGEKAISTLIVEKVVDEVRWSDQKRALWEKFERYLGVDGYALTKEVERGFLDDTIRITGLVPAMPKIAQLPEAMDEVNILLARFGFRIAANHLESAKKNIGQGWWEPANGQSRTFLEALTDAVADTLYSDDAKGKSSGLQKRQLLAEKGFLSREKHEFGDGNGQAFLPGLAKLLHTDGSHPGTSSRDEAMFRLQLVVVTARWLLKRFEKEK